MTKSPDKYKRIDCTLYDQIEIWSLKDTSLLIEIDDIDKQYHIKTSIKSTVTEDKAEYIITNEGQKIRMDHIKKMTPTSSLD